MLPRNAQLILEKQSGMLHKSREDKKVKDIISHWKKNGVDNDYIKKVILTSEEALGVLSRLKVNNETLLFSVYSAYSYLPLGQGAELNTLNQILEDSENPFWEDEHPNLSKRYLQISSIEGQGSYFYDKETDAVYDVGWEDMDKFAKGEFEPEWKSFYDFLEWYYSDSEEE